MKPFKILGATVLAMFLVGCAGARVMLNADELKYPVSLSQAIYTDIGEVVIPDKASYLDHFSQDFAAWSILWTLIPITGENDLSEMLNKSIEAHGGDAVVNLRVSASGDYFFALTSMIPFVPNAVHYTIEGDVVDLK